MRRIREKKFISIGFILILMGAIYIIGYGHSEKIQYNLSKEFNIEMVSYKNDNPKITYTLPFNWILELKSLENLKTPYYITFKAIDNSSYGYMQVKPLSKDFINRIKSLEVLDGKPVKDKISIEEKIKNGRNSIYIEYESINKDKEKYKIIEYYIFKEEEYLKMVISTKDNSFKDETKKTIGEIINNINF